VVNIYISVLPYDVDPLRILMQHEISRISPLSLTTSHDHYKH
jgi:hypothetical protein